MKMTNGIISVVMAMIMLFNCTACKNSVPSEHIWAEISLMKTEILPSLMKRTATAW